MSNTDPITTGIVRSLAINGESVHDIKFELAGPVGDTHFGFERRLSGHDDAYIKTSDLMDVIMHIKSSDSVHNRSK